MSERTIETALWGGLAAACGFLLAFILMKLFKVDKPVEHKLFLPLLAFGMLLVYLARGAIAADVNSERQFLECLATHNEAMAYYESLSVERKFEFTAQVLKRSYGPERANKYLAQREQALEQEEVMDTFFKAIILEITEFCVKDTTKGS